MPAEVQNRSLYLDTSLSEEIAGLAAVHMRSWSSQVGWLVHLGLRAKHLMPAAAPPPDEGRCRKYFYPSDKVATALDELQVLLNLDRPKDTKPWSFSALVRSLLANGMRIERQIARGIDAALERLTAAGDASTGRSHRALAMTLTIRHGTGELLEMLNSPPAEVATIWGDVREAWPDIISAALEARGRFDALGGGP